MRVIAGLAKGRRLRTVAGDGVRPTADKVRGAIFSILGSRFELEGSRLLDLFSGSGALGIEALSRGAAAVVFVEQSAAAQRVLQQNLADCRFEGGARIVKAPVARALSRLESEGASFDGVLLDPPYNQGLIAATLRRLAQSSLLSQDAWVLAEHHSDEPPPSDLGRLQLTQSRRYGKTALALLTTSKNMPKPERRQSVRAVYAGSFDPITNGHVDVIERALNVFDEVVIAVANTTSDPAKSNSLFTAAERVEMIREVLAQHERVTADSFTGLLVDYCEQVGARVSIRGLRAVSDFEYEFQMAMMNRHLKPNIETVFMASSEDHFYTSSRLVKEVARLGGNVDGLLPDVVRVRLLQKLRG